MAEIQVGEYLIDLDVVVPSGTQPVDFEVSLIDNNEIKQTKVFMFGQSAIGTKQTIEKAFKITEGGAHIIFFRGFTENPWGKSDPFESSTLSFELIPSVIPISLKDEWVLYYANEIDRWQLNSSELKADFRDRGWNIFKTIECESKSYVAPQWALFKKDYINNPSIVVISKGQTPIYAEGPKFWGPYIYRANSRDPGYVGYIYKGDEWLNGNNGRIFNIDNFALGKYIMVDGRAVLLVWTGARFDTGDLRPFRYAWKWVAEIRSSVTYPWFIMDKAGDVVDSG